MNNDFFTGVVEETICKITETLIRKGKEYSARDDRLSQFKDGAAFTGSTPEKVCFSFALKHLTSIKDMVDRLDENSSMTIEELAMWNEKLVDAINYMILLRACLIDRGELEQTMFPNITKRLKARK